MAGTYGGPMGIGSLITGGIGDLMQFGMGMGIYNDFLKMRGDALGRIDDMSSRSTSTLNSLLEGEPGAPGYKSRFADLYTAAARDANGIATRGIADYDNLYGTTTGQFARDTGDVLSGYNRWAGDLGSRMDTFSGDLNSRYAGRTARGLSMLEGAGSAYKREIEKRAGRQETQMQGKALASLAASGMGGTGLGASAARQISRDVASDKESSLGMLEESLRQQKANAYQALSGDELLARGKLGEMSIGLRERTGQAGLSAQERAANAKAQLASELGLATLGAKDDLSQWGFLTGQAMNEANLEKGMELGMMPVSMDQALTGMRTNAMLNWGQPPEVMNPFSGTANRLSSLAAAKMMQPKPEKKGLFGGALGGAAKGAGIGALADFGMFAAGMPYMGGLNAALVGGGMGGLMSL